MTKKTGFESRYACGIIIQTPIVRLPRQLLQTDKLDIFYNMPTTPLRPGGKDTSEHIGADHVNEPAIVLAASSEFHGYYYWLSQRPLDQRGWFQQERTLSRRMIYFAKDQVYFVCREQFLAEDGSAFHGNFLCEDNSRLKKDPNHTLWTILVKRYTKCGLTKPEDRLPAIQGPANVFQKLIRKRYCYGFWFENLTPCSLPNLLWGPGPDNALGPLESWRAPSWSFIRRLCWFHNPPDKWQRHTYLIKHSTSCVLQDGTIRVALIQSKIKTVKVNAARDGLTSLGFETLEEDGGYKCEISWVSDYKNTTPRSLSCLLLCTVDERTRFTYDEGDDVHYHYTTEVLLVQQSSHNCNGVYYQRIGRATVQSTHDWFESTAYETLYLD